MSNYIVSEKVKKAFELSGLTMVVETKSMIMVKVYNNSGLIAGRYPALNTMPLNLYCAYAQSFLQPSSSLRSQIQ